MFPIITKKRQALYEKTFSNSERLKNNIPEICGYYGRACRCMEDKANRRLCDGCSLSIFVSVAEAILERTYKKESLGLTKLYDSDIYNIQEKLKKKAVKVDVSYIEAVLEELIKD